MSTGNYFDSYNSFAIQQAGLLTGLVTNPTQALDKASAAVASFKECANQQNKKEISSGPIQQPVSADSNQVPPLEQAKASLGRRQESIRLRNDAISRLRELDAQEAPKSDPRRAEYERQIKNFDKQIQDETDFLTKLAEQNPDVAKQLGSKISILPQRAEPLDPFDFIFASDEDNEKDTAGLAWISFNYVSPFKPWIDKEMLETTEREAALMEAVYRKGEMAKIEYAQFLDRSEIENIINNPFPAQYDDNRLAAAFAQRKGAQT